MTKRIPRDPRLFLFQMKVKKTGDWRREILGDMTVMNAEEVRVSRDLLNGQLILVGFISYGYYIV